MSSEQQNADHATKNVSTAKAKCKSTFGLTSTTATRVLVAAGQNITRQPPTNGIVPTSTGGKRSIPKTSKPTSKVLPSATNGWSNDPQRHPTTNPPTATKTGTSKLPGGLQRVKRVANDVELAQPSDGKLVKRPGALKRLKSDMRFSHCANEPGASTLKRRLLM
eukprot:GHVN01042803.1.p1 GENE.GHVN01042803.1~~GHVN01042803.1.p1  ORF type:complete len:177 (-),score=19.95 GHVN01042803.1:67-558(-)